MDVEAQEDGVMGKIIVSFFCLYRLSLSFLEVIKSFLIKEKALYHFCLTVFP